MARITIQDVKTSMGITETYDIVNAIRNSSPQFQQYVPLASVDNITEVGQGILVSQTLQNDFITALIDRIGLVVVRHVSLQNPLKMFKKGMLPQGRSIEEIFTDITKGQKYDPDDAESTLFKRQIPNVKTLFHERNRQDFYTQTVTDEQLKSAFVSWGAFESFVSSILTSIYNSAEVEEFEYMKLIIDNYFAKGLFTVIPITDPVDATSASQFVKVARATATKLCLPNGSRDYNALAVRTRSEMDDLYIIMDADLNAEIDVDVLAKAFNMDRTTFLGHSLVIDGFASSGLKAVMVDKQFFMVYDQLLKMETVRNSKGLYWNYFLHVWQVLSASRFANAVAFVTGTVPAVTSVIVDPTIAERKAGKTLQLNAYVRATDGNAHDVVWTVEASTSATVKQAGTTIDSTGLLTIASNQTGELRVIATVAGAGIDVDGAGPDTTDVTGEAIITVIPA
jgi:uncharacterized protein YjdB